jgi:hypothetical protein
MKEIEQERNIYNMKLHQTLTVEDGNLFTTVLRVPGGWMYRSYDKSHQICTSAFVPYTDGWGPITRTTGITEDPR